ncbi:MAG: DUF3341 domain-containing protein [Cytophagales bacterium]|nr:MAG: DUF3341 domain-containing protein [Cytophagales bacterium]
MSVSKHFILGVFDDEDVLMHGVHDIRNLGVKIQEVFTPYPIHGLDENLGYKRSRLPMAAFLFGLTGCTLALSMMISMNGIDWPMNVGGKPNASIPNFIPITFEGTVLFAAFGMVGTFFVSSGLAPWSKPVIFDKRSTDDKFIVAIDLSKNKLSKDELSQILMSHGATEVNEKEL